MNPITTRRTMATTAALVAAGLLAAGCGSSSNSAAGGGNSSTTTTTPATSGPAPTTGASTAPAPTSGTGASAGSSAPSVAPSVQQTVSATGGSGTSCTSTSYAGGVSKLDMSDPSKITVGFAQSEATSNPFRATETDSIVAAAKKLGVKLIQTNANGSGTQENTDIESLINQGAQFLIVAPEDSTSESAAFAMAKSKKIPVLTIDRTVNGTACSDFIGFIGSNFAGQATIAADDLGASMSGKGNVAILEGSTGNNVAVARTDGFKKEIAAKYPNIKVVADQTANFDLATGQKVMAQFLQAHPDISGVYAENDEMALGALTAIKQAGKTASATGSGIRIVSIDGVKEFIEDIKSGEAVADVETNPRFGPLAFQAMADFYSGKGVAATVIIKDHHFTKSNAAVSLTNGSVY